MSDWSVITGHFLTRAEVARLTGLSTAEVVTRPGLLKITCRISGAEAYPAFQFDASGRPVSGLGDVVGGLAGRLTELEIAALLSTPADGLGGRVPIAFLRDGGSTRRVLGLVA